MKMTLQDYIDRTKGIMKHFGASFRNRKKTRFEFELPEELVKILDEDVAFYKKYYNLDGHALNRSKYIYSIIMEARGLSENNRGKIVDDLTYKNKNMTRYIHVKHAKEFFDTGVTRKMIPEKEMEIDLEKGVKPKKKTTTKK